MDAHKISLRATPEKEFKNLLKAVIRKKQAILVVGAIYSRANKL
jgi:hypothetical protein